MFLGISILGFVEILHLILYFFQTILISNTEMSVDKLNNAAFKDSTFEELRKKAKFLKIDAVPNIIKGSNSIEKLCWITLLLSSSSVCVFLFVGSIREYLKYEVTTTNRILQDRNVKFPSISICHINPFNTNSSVELSREANWNFNGDYVSLTLFLENYVHNKTGQYMNDEEKQKLTNFENILLSCKIGNKECNSSMFSWTWNPILFNCYRFNLEMDVYGIQRNSLKVY